jgi:hypothetical protein
VVKVAARQGESRPFKIINGPKLPAKIKSGKEKRQGRSGMAKDLEPYNKAQPTQGVRAEIKVVLASESITLGYSLKPESRISAAAVVVVRHNPKACQEEKRPSMGRSVPLSLDQVKIASPVNGKERGYFHKTVGSMQEAMGVVFELSLTSSSQILCVSSEALYGQNPLEAMEILCDSK